MFFYFFFFFLIGAVYVTDIWPEGFPPIPPNIDVDAESLGVIW